MKVNLAAEDDLPQIVWSIGMKASDRRMAMDVIRDRRAEFLVRWKDIHGEGA